MLGRKKRAYFEKKNIYKYKEENKTNKKKK